MIRTEAYGTNSDQNRSVRTEIRTVMDKNVISVTIQSIQNEHIKLTDITDITFKS